MQYVYALNRSIVLIIPDTSQAEKFPVRAVDIALIREYNDDSSTLTYINKY